MFAKIRLFSASVTRSCALETMTSAANGNVAIFPLVAALANGRLLRVATIGDLSGCTVELIRHYHDHDSAIVNTPLANTTR